MILWTSVFSPGHGMVIGLHNGCLSLKENQTTLPDTLSTALGWRGKAALVIEARFTAGFTLCPKAALITVKFPQTQNE